ncbi:neuropilin-1a-like [Acropora palmata]|uniref:neuropilin-1a-like n=1 Tax=Acropora palmata TaxID=6131 RepID=UPI003DA17C7B
MMIIFTGGCSQLALLEAATLVFLSIHCWQRTAGDDACRITRSVSEFALSEHVIFSLRGKRLASCVATCDRDARCLSINYYATLKRCDFNDKTAELYPSDLKPTEGAVYITMVSRDYKQSPPCVGVCLPITAGSLVRGCRCTENAIGLNDSCSKPLGMEDGSIKDQMISVSSTHSTSKKAWGRLHNTKGSWTPNDDNTLQWFQVNFQPEVKRIMQIATQGNGNSHYWVKKYYIMFQKQGAPNLERYVESNKQMTFTGNNNQYAVVKNKISNPFDAIAVRIVPIEFSGRIALRVELYGCDIK